MQEKYIKINNLQVSEKLSNFVNDELLKNTNVSSENFWLGLEKTLDDLAPKNKQLINKNVDNFFDWIKGAELVELKECNTAEDPVRPELDNVFRRSYGRKIYGVKYMGEIHAVMCFAYTNEIPKNVDELDKFSHDAFLQSAQRDQNVGKIAVAYTVWSKKKGGGKLIVKEVFKKIKESNHLNRLVTLSPLTDMAHKFHSRNKAKLIQVNETTQNFEYQVSKNNR